MKKRLLSIVEELDSKLIAAAKQKGITVNAQIALILFAWSERERACEREQQDHQERP